MGGAVGLVGVRWLMVDYFKSFLTNIFTTTVTFIF
jgi:hypothetical protein